MVKDWFSKEIIGASFSITSTARDWLNALDAAINRQYPQGIEGSQQRPKLITDNGCQPLSTTFMDACGVLGIKQIFTSFNNPQGNADTERVIRTIKEDTVWPFNWQSPLAFEQYFNQRVDKYNHDFPHMSLDWKTPAQFAKNTLLEVA